MVVFVAAVVAGKGLARFDAREANELLAGAPEVELGGL